MKEIHPHFLSFAHRYKDLRTTDVEPILFVKKKLQDLNKIEAADVGCGVGRYATKLFHHLGERLHLTCIDHNRRILKELAKNFREHRIESFKTINASAVALPLASNFGDAIITFNAIHHFKCLDFLKETSRVLREKWILVYLQSPTKPKQEKYLGKIFSWIP
ncbi:MAG: class I SAM-dependent methyltransferase [Nitrospirota bacterium]|nr:class I SAM-dependent methyltransferase [Nitrospirota bacterium]